jgi:hypothetical protein
MWCDSRVRIPAQCAGDRMKRFIEGQDRGQSTLFPECLEDWIDADNPVRVIIRGPYFAATRLRLRLAAGNAFSPR